MSGSVESESAFREEANAADKGMVVCWVSGWIVSTSLDVNAVAKMNDLFKFDEFYLPYKGVTIPCWILSTLQGGNNTLMNFIYPTRGSWLWTL